MFPDWKDTQAWQVKGDAPQSIPHQKKFSTLGCRWLREGNMEKERVRGSAEWQRETTSFQRGKKRDSNKRSRIRIELYFLATLKTRRQQQKIPSVLHLGKLSWGQNKDILQGLKITDLTYILSQENLTAGALPKQGNK